MAENGIPPRYNVSQEANHKAEATKKDNLLVVLEQPTSHS